MTVTSAHARVLMGEAMDARALNLAQTQALINDTPEVDCIADLLAVLVAQGVRPSAVARLFTLTREIVESNIAEGGHEMVIAGSLDDIASRLYDQERNGQQEAMSVKAMGEQLRWALPIAYKPAGHSAADVVRAGGIVHRILERTPAGQLFTPSMHKELRDTNYGRLKELHARFNNRSQEAA